MHITGIGTSQLPPLGFLHLECDEHANLFIGPNASGKSTILRMIERVCASGQASEFNNIEFHTLTDEPASIYVEPSDDWPRDPPDSEAANWDAAALIYIPATRVHLPGMDLIDQTIKEPQNVETDATRKRLFDSGSEIFSGVNVEREIEYIRESMKNDRDKQVQFRIALQIGYSCARRICHEVILDYGPHPYVEVKEEEDEESYWSEKVVHYNMGIVTTDNILGEPLYAGALSSGTQGTLLWVWALAITMVNHYWWKEGWEKKPAILLIDEIENHLHPTWQRRVIPALLEHFPGLQIFATTHSPFVVAGLKAGQVHLLRRDEEGRVIVTTNTEDVVGWTADEILRTMMGVEDPTDAETAEAARELRQLRNEAPRSDPTEEEQRQQRIQELRQLVDRDLLAGGPMAAQRELFEEQFTEALKKYQQSQGLNQENG